MNRLLELRGVTVRYGQAGAWTSGAARAAVEEASFALEAGEMLGLVGESGCGKSTLGRAILRLVPLAAGEVRWQGRRIDDLGRREFQGLRRELQLVFQDPNACLDPRMTLGESVAEPLRAFSAGRDRAGRAERVAAALAEVGLDAEFAGRYPHQASGGQLQRAVIARALIVDPRFVVCDEPVSALDVSVQGQIVNLLARVRRERRLASLFISHNLAVVARLCERIMVMYLGRMVEIAPRASLLRAPMHPYTRRLLDAVPRVAPGLRRPVATGGRMEGRNALAGSADARGCAFAARCPLAIARCLAERPALEVQAPAHLVACHRAGEWRDGLPPAAG